MTDQAVGTEIPLDGSPRGDVTATADGEPPKKAELPRDEKGQFAKFDAEASTVLTRLMERGGKFDDATPAGDEKQSTSDQPEEAPEEKSDPKLEKAKRLLRLEGGWTDKAFEAHSPEELIELSSQRAKRASDVGKALQENAKLRERLEQLEAAQATGATDSNGATGAKDQSGGYKALAEQFGEDAAKAFRTLLDETTKPLRDKLEQYEQSAVQARAAHTGRELETQRARLREAYPRLSEEAPWKAILSAIEGMGQEAFDYDSLGDVFDAAAEALYGEAPHSQAKRQQGSRAKSNGQPAKPQRREAPKAMTVDDRMELVFNRLSDGVPADQVRAELNRL